jgi:hypothetical protein
MDITTITADDGPVPFLNLTVFSDLFIRFEARHG